MKKLLGLLLALCLLVMPLGVNAEDAAPAEAVATAEATAAPVVTQHTAQINGKALNYTATVGTMPVTVEDNDCEIFYTAYTLDGVENLSDRPITFAFNGGPGSSSEWVHMGMLGPRRIDVDEDGNPTQLPVKLVDNEHSILDITDLVFIDPVGTGYSTAAEGVDPAFFFNYANDIGSVAEFVRLYVSRNGRWGSPKYLAGESYGTVRAVGLAEALSAAYDMAVNGVMLISSINDFSTAMEFANTDLSYVLMLPTYAASAWYHKALDDKYQSMALEDFLEEAKAFASGEYQTALFQGDRLTEDERNATAEKLAAYTGLKQDFVLKNDLRVYAEDFRNALLEDQKLKIGRIDSRYTGPMMEGVDPSNAVLGSTFGAAINQYLGDELGYHTDKTYETINSAVNAQWQYGLDNRALDQKGIIYSIMSQNRFLKIWVLCGYYDMATPYSAAEWVYNHLSLNEETRRNLSFTYYQCGHMIYMHQPSLAQFRQEAEAWYQAQ